MKQERAGSRHLNDDLQDLDTLVLAEIESLRSRDLSKEACPPDKLTAKRTVVPSAGAPTPRGTSAQVAPIHRRTRDESTCSGEEFNRHVDNSLMGDVEGLSSADVQSAGNLLSAEEAAFVARAVGFLSQRDHADMILGRIWEQLTELDPDGFYQPPASAKSVLGTAEIDVAGAKADPSQTQDG